MMHVLQNWGNLFGWFGHTSIHFLGGLKMMEINHSFCWWLRPGTHIYLKGIQKFESEKNMPPFYHMQFLSDGLHLTFFPLFQMRPHVVAGFLKQFSSLILAKFTNPQFTEKIQSDRFYTQQFPLQNPHLLRLLFFIFIFLGFISLDLELPVWVAWMGVN